MSHYQILGILLAYFGVLILISWLSGKNSDATSFYTGNKKSPWFLVAFGMIGASLSGVTFLSVPGWVANTHFGYMQTVFGYMVGYLIIAQVLIPLYYKQNLTSIYTYLQTRFGLVSYKTGAAYFLLSRIIGASFRLFLVAGVLHTVVFEPFHIPYWGAVAITILLIFTYTAKNGIKTVVYTDALQTFFLVAAVILTIVFIVQELDWSMAETVSNLMADPNTQIFHFEGNGANVFWKQFLGGAFIALAMTGLDQDMMQKNLSCKSLKDAQKNMVSMASVLIVVNLVFLFLGALLYMYARANSISFEKSDMLFSAVAMDTNTPVIIGVLFLLGLIAAAYSSADSALTSLTTSIFVDLIPERRKTEDNKVPLRKSIHVAVSILIILVVLGTLIGLIPAFKATSIKPIEALREE